MYLIMIDYFSRWIEIPRLRSKTTSALIQVIKSIFSRFGYPEELRSDGGP